MKTLRCLIPVSLCWMLWISVLPVAAEIYRYADENGKIRYTDDLTRVPERRREKADEYIEFQASKPASGAVSDTKPDASFRDLKTEADLNAAGLRLEEIRETLEKERTRLIEEQQRLDKVRRVSNSKIGSRSYRKQLGQFQKDTEAYRAKRQAFEADLTWYNAQVETFNRDQTEKDVEPESD